MANQKDPNEGMVEIDGVRYTEEDAKAQKLKAEKQAAKTVTTETANPPAEDKAVKEPTTSRRQKSE